MCKILLGKLFKRRYHGVTVAFLYCLTVSPEFRMAAVGIHYHAGQRLCKPKSDGCQHKAKAVIDTAKAKGFMKLGMPNCQPNHQGHQQKIAEIHDLLLQYILVQTVTQLVGKYCADLLRGHCVDQVVIQNDGL